MKISQIIKYIITPMSYGVLFAVVLLFVIPSLQNNFNFNKAADNTQVNQPPLSYAKAVSLAGPAVVNIYSSEINKSSKFDQQKATNTRLGSGVIMDSSGYILTNYHVVQNTQLIEVLLQSGTLYSAQLIGFDAPTDLAVLKVNASHLPIIPQKPEQISLAGDVVLAIGNPLNLGQTVTQGIISATGRSGLSNISYLEFLQMDAAINDGNSGGALVNTNGELVGINSRKFTNSQLNIQGIFFAIPYQLANKIMEKIIEKGRVIRGWLGISARNYMSDITGVVITGITPNSPAQRAGLLSGDVIYQIGDVAVSTVTEAFDVVAETPPNTTLIFSLYRNKKQLKLPVTIIEQ